MITIDGFVIDASITERHVMKSTTTSYPVEDSADVTDHVRNLPVEVTLDCVVSDTPLINVSFARTIDTLPSVDAYAKLVDIRNKRSPVTIKTSLTTYTNMILTEISIPESADVGDSIRFSASFKQIELITNKRTVVEVSIPRASKKADRGSREAPVEEPPQKTKVYRSRLKAGLSALKGAF